MAIGCCSPIIMMAPPGVQSLQTNKAMARVYMLHNNNNQTQAKSGSTPSSRVYMVNKVFEDQVKGIACYVDDKGELVCEGYDEGPRFNRRSSASSQSLHSAKHRDVSAVAPYFLHHSWLHTAEDAHDFQYLKGKGIGLGVTMTIIWDWEHN